MKFCSTSEPNCACVATICMKPWGCSTLLAWSSAAGDLGKSSAMASHLFTSWGGTFQLCKLAVLAGVTQCQNCLGIPKYCIIQRLHSLLAKISRRLWYISRGSAKKKTHTGIDLVKFVHTRIPLLVVWLYFFSIASCSLLSPVSWVVPLPNCLNGFKMGVANYLLTGMILQVVDKT